jgi:hypothetical protein
MFQKIMLYHFEGRKSTDILYLYKDSDPKGQTRWPPTSSILI